jgi:hypothetical protein
MTEYTDRIDPEQIYFTHSKIRYCFTGCNKTIDETLNDIRNNKISFNDLPKITVYISNGNYFSQNNRRLYVAKICKHEGLLENDLIEVRVKKMPNKKNYTPTNCSLMATPCLK